MPTAPTIENRIRGAMYGALVGDALGVPVEFCARAERDADPVTGMRAWGTHRQPAGTWSDDGSLLLCTAEGVCDSFSPDRLGTLYVSWMKAGHWASHGRVFDIGGATRSALTRIAHGVASREAGETSESQNGNGSLMRILPVALRFRRSPASQLAEMSMIASAITHAHVRSQLACAFYCSTVTALLRDASPSEAYRLAIDESLPLFENHAQERVLFGRILDGNLQCIDRQEICASGYVLHTLEASLWCLLQYPNIHDVVLAAVNLGDDADTTGCVAGGLAGAAYGFDAIPSEWITVLPRQTELAELVTSFVAASLKA